MKTSAARIELIITLVIFGTIGIMSRFINMPSSVICLSRALIGAIIIAIYLGFSNKRLDITAIKHNFPWLLLSSTMMCLNWVCQFEAFKYTTIATATLCYYMQPIFYMIAGVLVFKETLGRIRRLAILVAFTGMILVSGVIDVGFKFSELKGAIFGIVGGFFYAMVVLINKYIKDIGPVDTTITQLGLVTILMIPYTILSGGFTGLSPSTLGIVCLLILGLFHTGISYIVYFDAVNKLPAKTVGILSYIDPVVAVVLSALVLKENLTGLTALGAILIIGAAVVSEYSKE